MKLRGALKDPNSALVKGLYLIDWLCVKQKVG